MKKRYASEFTQCIDCGGRVWKVKNKPKKRCFSCLHNFYLTHPGPAFKTGRGITAQGYISVLAKGHPHASKEKPYILEHRLVAEKKIGRWLKSNESVHHINGIKTDNRPENLVVLTKTAHQLVHHFKQSKCDICDRPHCAKGLCKFHWQRLRRQGGTFADIPSQTGIPLIPKPKVIRYCKLNGCTRKFYGRGFCHAHYESRRIKGLFH